MHDFKGGVGSAAVRMGRRVGYPLCARRHETC